MNNGDSTTRRNVSRSGQSDVVDGSIVISKGGGNDNKNNRDKYDACRINVDGIVISLVSPTSKTPFGRGTYLSHTLLIIPIQQYYPQQ